MPEWRIVETKHILRQIKKLSDQQKKRYREAVHLLATSTNPRQLGTFKHAKKYSAYYYEMGSSFRLVYDVIDQDLVIILLEVGDHKTVYGHD